MRGHTSIRAIGLISASWVGLGFTAAAWAQQAATVAPGKGDQLEEITVTAQKRAESVQDVPIAITALIPALDYRRRTRHDAPPDPRPDPRPDHPSGEM